MKLPTMTLLMTFSDRHITSSDDARLTLHSRGEENSPSTLRIYEYDGGYFVGIGSTPHELDGADELARAGYSAAFLALIRLASHSGAGMVRIDRDGPVVDSLPTFNWGEK